MSISMFFSDENVLAQLRTYFDEEERDNIDETVLTNINDCGGFFELVYKDKLFVIDGLTGSVKEVSNE